jgi:hypothetical protein
MVEDKVVLQGKATDEATQNANLELFDIAGVDHVAIIHANNDKISKITNDLNDDDGIIAISDVPNHQIHKNTIVLNEKSN